MSLGLVAASSFKKEGRRRGGPLLPPPPADPTPGLALNVSVHIVKRVRKTLSTIVVSHLANHISEPPRRRSRAPVEG